MCPCFFLGVLVFYVSVVFWVSWVFSVLLGVLESIVFEIVG